MSCKFKKDNDKWQHIPANPVNDFPDSPIPGIFNSNQYQRLARLASYQYKQFFGNSKLLNFSLVVTLAFYAGYMEALLLSKGKGVNRWNR